MIGTGGKLDIETRWAQEVVERQGGKLRHWNQVEMHAKSCWEARGEVLRASEWMQEIGERHKGGGSLDIEARWMLPSGAQRCEE